jgi:peptidoglycan hydrolase-like protein with peptidoglycan-binding domain
MLLPIAALAVPAPGASAASAAYRAAQRDFLARFTLADRLLVQNLLIGAGYSNGVATGDFGARQFEAVRQFQSENGFYADGDLNGPQLEKLAALARPWFATWGFRKLFHPGRDIPLWVPMGLGLRESRTDTGLRFADPQRRLTVDFSTFARTPIAAGFALLTRLYEEKDARIHYKVFKDGWFVISATTPDGVDHYLRYHQDGPNVTGFSLMWNNANGDVHGERIAIVMSGGLWAAMTGAPAIDPPAPPPAPPAAVAPPAKNPDLSEVSREPAKPPEPAKSSETVSTGTGFFISGDGAFVTSAHVIADCSQIKAKTAEGASLDARVVARDAANDLALLKAETSGAKAATLRATLRLGESVAAFGFPHSDILATSGNFTLGNVTALSGLGDDSRFAQISTPVQAGNSGGPLLDHDGNVVGVVAMKLNALKVASEGGDLPQNVNFAVKAALLANFLDANKVAYLPAVALEKPLDPADLADRARAISLFVTCK